MKTVRSILIALCVMHMHCTIQPMKDQLRLKSEQIENTEILKIKRNSDATCAACAALIGTGWLINDLFFECGLNDLNPQSKKILTWGTALACYGTAAYKAIKAYDTHVEIKKLKNIRKQQ